MMTFKKKFFAILLALALNAFAAWDGKSTLEPSKTSIEGRQYYTIGSPEELAWFAGKVNLGDTAISAVLTADIDLNSKAWTPIGKDSTCEFDGIFDGDGHSVSGISVSNRMYAGLFGILDVGSVKNLVIESSIIKGFYEKCAYSSGYCSYVGGVAGSAHEYSSIRNVVNRASHVAATNNQSSYRRSYMGGIVGYSKGEVIKCTNEADLSVSDSALTIGGLVGYAYYGKFDSLNNTGVIKGGRYTGGVLGWGNNGLWDIIVSNSTNSGDVEGNRFVGGICGYCGDGSGRIRSSVNKGLIKGIGLSKDSLRVGGICGEGIVDSSRNQGNIDVEGSRVINAYVGGISGQSQQITLSLNYGDISATLDSTLYVGGVAGYVDGVTSGSRGVQYSGNFGYVKATTTGKKREAYAGGIVGKIHNSKKEFLNIFNQGAVQSTHYAAGIAPILPQDLVFVKNFYVATDKIDAPNAAAFVNYNSATGTLQNGYLDGTLLDSLSLVGENLGVGKDLFVVNTKVLQSDSIAYVLDIANFSEGYKSSFYNTSSRRPTCHWSRDDGYPIFADSVHNPIYQVIFTSHKKCSSLSCELDSNKRYTTYKGLVSSIPELTDGNIWVLQNQGYMKKYTSSNLKSYEFGWSDSLVVALYKNCNDLASTDIGCCVNYMFEFQEEYANAYNRYIDMLGHSDYTHVSKDAVAMNYCLDDNNDGVLNWNDSSSYLHTLYNSQKNNIATYNGLYNQSMSSSSVNQTNVSSSSNGQSENIVQVKDELPNCNSKRFGVVYYVEEDDADYKCEDYKWINLSNPQTVSNASINMVFLPKVFAKERSIQIENMSSRERIVILDVQGRIVKNVLASSSMKIPVSFACRYYVMIGKTIMAIDIK